MDFDREFILTAKFSQSTVLKAVLEELPNKHWSKKMGDSIETNETEPDILQRQWNKEHKVDQKVEGEELWHTHCPKC